MNRLNYLNLFQYTIYNIQYAKYIFIFKYNLLIVLYFIINL